MGSKKIMIGFMGSGKTTFGSHLAKEKKLPWIDLDLEIEKRENKSIPQIFKEKGETYFREIEHEVLRQHLLDEGAKIISTGGGIIENDKNRKLLMQEDTIFLNWEFKTLYDRVIKDTNRPLAKNYDGLHKLYTKRLPLYKACASKEVICEGKTMEEIIQEIGEDK